LLFEPLKMSVETLVGLPYQFSVESLLASSGFVARYQQDGLALRIECNATRHSPSTAANRRPFIFAWREPSSVSTRGRPIEARIAEEGAQGKNFRLRFIGQVVKFRLELITHLNNPRQM
jgi:hypothetical protein